MPKQTVFWKTPRGHDEYLVIDAATPRDAAENIADDGAFDGVLQIKAWSGSYDQLPLRAPDYEIDNG